MKILHLIIDHQVVERTIGIYEKVFPDANEVIIFDIYNRPPKHLDFLKTKKVVSLGQGYDEGRKYDFSTYTHIIAHFMSMDAINFIKSTPQYIHVCWEIYGWDLYDQFLAYNGMELYYTDKHNYSKYKYIYKCFPHLTALINFFRGNKYSLTYFRNKQFKYISNRVDSIQYCCKYDAKYVEEYSKRSIPSYEIFNYSLSQVLGSLKELPFFEASDIMIGNSASFSNNHLYALEFLEKVKLPKESTILMPLSYGGTPEYAKDIELMFKEVFPQNKFKILKHYIPLQDYNQLFTTLNTIILPAWRQESQGTAILAFYLGIKVIMSEHSPLYKWFLDCGFVVYPIEKIKAEDYYTPLTLSEKQRNRNIVLQRYNDDAFNNTLKTRLK